jgi:single-strand DNA-binding protein
MNNLSNSVRLTGRLGAAPEMKEFDDDKKLDSAGSAALTFEKCHPGLRSSGNLWVE